MGTDHARTSEGGPPPGEIDRRRIDRRSGIVAKAW